jgi:hypothetical protein
LAGSLLSGMVVAALLSTVRNIPPLFHGIALAGADLTSPGCITLAVSLIVIGITGCFKQGIWAQVVFMAVWSFTYQSTIGSVAWPIVTEVSKSSLRNHTQSLATITSGIVGAISGVCLPFMVNPDEGNMGGKVGFVYGALLGLSCVGVWMYYPETKGRTFAEIDRLFEMRVHPRKFARTKLDD